MFSIPASRIFAIWLCTLSLVELTQVRWAMEATPSSMISLAISTVYWLVPPPAPYVQLTKAGRSCAISRTVARTESSFTSDLGGKTSMEIVTGFDLRI